MSGAGDYDQAALLRALSQSTCYPHEAGPIERLETHISAVLLAGEYAYKIKKPVNFGFLDYSTLALRRHFCAEELRLNRRLAPQLYLDVVAIAGSAETPRFVPADDPGAFEYAVKMRRFPQSALLDHMLANGELQLRHLDALAETVATFHAGCAVAETGTKESGYGMPESIVAPVRENFSQIRPLLETAAERADLDEIERWSLAAHESLAPLMAERLRQGRVRECHGDLHLGNIVWLDEAIVVFDCIEFNPALHWIDVASEIAFTVMDLAARGRPDWGARFLNAYLEISGDYAALPLLPYYMVYRAMVRAKVARLRMAQTEGEARRLASADFFEHLRLARAFTATRQPALLLMHGVSGSGKTTATQPLVEQIGAVRLRSDVERKRLHGLTREARSGSALGTGIYGETANAATYVELRRLAGLVIAAGYPAIVDATCLRRSQRDFFRSLAVEMSVPCLILDCRADPAELRRRVAQRQAAGRDVSEANMAVLERQLQQDEALDDTEMEAAVIIDTQHQASEEIVARVRRHL